MTRSGSRRRHGEPTNHARRRHMQRTPEHRLQNRRQLLHAIPHSKKFGHLIYVVPNSPFAMHVRPESFAMLTIGSLGIG
jgi:hypothetical protein